MAVLSDLDYERAGLLDDFVAGRGALARSLRLAVEAAWNPEADHDALDADVRAATGGLVTLADLIPLDTWH